ncbi:MAG: SIR2 family protein [Verrucomicrobia bacterium]|nr:SIR2 family protein [Verrucomicrobiota bacterium]
MPFVGAGISTAFGFKDWKALLLGAAPPSLAQIIKEQLSANLYEEAAETLLKELGADAFQNMVAASAGDSNLEPSSLRVGTVSLLPLIAGGPVMTTNFDRVLERAFEANGAPFESVISGPRPDLIVDALHGNRRVLIKLHGDWQDRVGRTFAQSDCDANYGNEPQQKRVPLVGVESLLFSSRSLLFIGASLGPGRTVRLLQEVHQNYAGIRHFAIMAVPRDQGAFEEKEKHLRSCGVLPLWYLADDPGQHACR